jgi:hypothetical protein
MPKLASTSVSVNGVELPPVPAVPAPVVDEQAQPMGLLALVVQVIRRRL